MSKTNAAIRALLYVVGVVVGAFTCAFVTNRMPSWLLLAVSAILLGAIGWFIYRHERSLS